MPQTLNHEGVELVAGHAQPVHVVGGQVGEDHLEVDGRQNMDWTGIIFFFFTFAVSRNGQVNYIKTAGELANFSLILNQCIASLLCLF